AQIGRTARRAPGSPEPLERPGGAAGPAADRRPQPRPGRRRRPRPGPRPHRRQLPLPRPRPGQRRNPQPSARRAGAGGARRHARPKPDGAAADRPLLVHSTKLPPRSRWLAVEVLRNWSGGRRFGAEQGQWKPELTAWGRWFSQSFPKEPPLPDLAADSTASSKYRYDDLLRFLTQDPAGMKGDATRGRAVFAKANCAKCHKFGA